MFHLVKTYNFSDITLEFLPHHLCVHVLGLMSGDQTKGLMSSMASAQSLSYIHPQSLLMRQNSDTKQE